MKQIDGFGLYDANGEAVALSWLPSNTTMRSIADLPGFAALRAEPKAELGIANVYRWSDGVWALPLGRRLETPAGEFAGLIGARGLVDHFQDFYRDIRFDAGTKVTLLHRDGTLLARYPPLEGSLGSKYPPLDEALAVRARGDAGPWRARSPIDGVERFVAVRAVPDYPLAVFVTRDADVALAPWRAQSVSTAGRMLALGLLAALLLVVVSRQLQRLDAAHDSLAASRERFALAVAGSDDGIWDWDRRTDVVYASARARELYGLPPGPDTTPRDVWFAQIQWHPDDVAPRRAAVEAHMAGQTPLYEFEYRVRHPNGGYRWLRARGLCVRDASGQVLRMAGSVSDIDARRRAEEERRQSEQALRVSEERFALAVAGSDVGVWDWDLEAGMAFESARARELQGLPPGPELQPLDQLVASLRVHPDDVPLRAERIRAHLAAETPAYEVDYRVRHDDRQYRWVRIRALCVRDVAGKPYRMAGSVVGIDAQRRAEEGAAPVRGALRDRDDRLGRGALGLERQDRRAVLVAAAAPADRHHGDAPATRSEWRARVPMHPDDRDRTQRAVDDHLAGLTPRLSVEFRIVDPVTGDVRWICTRAQCFRDARRPARPRRGLDVRDHRAQARRGRAARIGAALRARRCRVERRHVGLGHAQRDLLTSRPARRSCSVSIRASRCGPARNGGARFVTTRTTRSGCTTRCRRTWAVPARPGKSSTGSTTYAPTAGVGSASAASRCATSRAGRIGWPVRSKTSRPARAPRPSATGSRRNCASRRSSRRWARWPAASRTTSTTSSPRSWVTARWCSATPRRGHRSGGTSTLR